MKHRMLIMLVLLLSAPTHAQELPHPLDLNNGYAGIAMSNSVGADRLVVSNPSNAACSLPVPSHTINDPPGQVFVWVPDGTANWAPDGPPVVAGCLLRPGNQLFVSLYHGDVFLEERGPYAVRAFIYLPAVMGAP